jgi:signal transduction histidine kinase
MLEMARTHEPRLVLRFAVASLLVFLVVGVAAMVLIVRSARDRAERAGAEHASFVADAVLAPALEWMDLSEPLTGTDYARVHEVVRERILAGGRDVRVKVWSPDGTIVFADEPELVGMRFPEEVGELAEVLEGRVESGISELAAAENVEERKIADKLLEVYAPLRAEPGGPVVAVAELYQDYSFIQADIDAFVARLAPVLAVGLLLLYAAVLPIAVRASRELRRRNEQLNRHLVRERQTVTELRDLHQKKDDFVSAVSHELRSPLTSIAGSLATLRRLEPEGDPAVQDELLGAAERQTRRLGRVIANLLSTAHLDGSRPLTSEPVDLAATARIVAADLDATERVRIDMPKAPVWTDRDRVAQLLTYLLDNALKFSPEDSPIDIGAIAEGGEVRIWVTDRGVGIDPSHRDAIFERFHQIDQSATRQHGGLGLGLHLARDLVHELGGRVEVSSTLGSGSTFTVSLPTTSASDAATTGSHPSAPSAAHASAPAG